MRKKASGAATDSLLLTLVKLTTALISLATTKIMSVSLGLNEYGTYSQGVLIVSITISLIILGMNDSINYFFNRNNSIDEQKRYIDTIFAIEVVLGLVAAVGILIFQNRICDYFSNAALKIVLYVICSKALFENLVNLFGYLYISIGEARTIAIRNLLISIARIPITLLAVKNENSVVVMFTALLIVDIVQMLYFYLGFRKRAFSINVFRAERRYIVEILKYGIPMGAYAFASMLNRDLDKLIIGNMGTTDMLAIYSNCARVLPFDILMGSVATVMIPFVVKSVNSRDYDSAAAIYRSYVSIGALSVWTLAGGAIVVAPELIAFLYDTKYLTGTGVFIIYLLVDIVKFVNMSLFITAKGNSVWLLRCSLAALVTNAILNYILFKTMGMTGPAVATLVVTAIMNVAILSKGAKVIETPLSKLIAAKELFLFACELMVSGVVFYGIKKLLLDSQVNSIVSMIVTYALFVGMNVAINGKRFVSLFRQMNSFRIDGGIKK